MEENETTKRLAAYAALVAVPTMIAGVYGMNFEHMPELDWNLGYPVAIALMAVIDVYLSPASARRAGCDRAGASRKPRRRSNLVRVSE